MVQKKEQDECNKNEQKEHRQRKALLKDFARIKAYQEKHQTQQQQQ